MVLRQARQRAKSGALGLDVAGHVNTMVVAHGVVIVASIVCNRALDRTLKVSKSTFDTPMRVARAKAVAFRLLTLAVVTVGMAVMVLLLRAWLELKMAHFLAIMVNGDSTKVAPVAFYRSRVPTMMWLTVKLR